MLALGIENMNFGIVQGNDDVLVSEMQAGHDTLIGCNLSLVDLAASPPSGFDLVLLLEMGAVSHGLWSSADGRRRQDRGGCCSIKTLDTAKIRRRSTEAGKCGVMYAQSMSGEAERRSRVGRLIR